MTISKSQCELLIEELKPVINEIMARHNMDAKFNWKYGALFELKMTATSMTKGPNGVNLDSVEAQYFTKFGFSDFAGRTLNAPLGTLFESRGETYAFAGIAAKRRKYPIVGLNIIDGTMTLFTDMLVSKLNEKAAAPAAV
jgi:hypothetical protein